MPMAVLAGRSVLFELMLDKSQDFHPDHEPLELAMPDLGHLAGVQSIVLPEKVAGEDPARLERPPDALPDLAKTRLRTIRKRHRGVDHVVMLALEVKLLDFLRLADE